MSESFSFVFLVLFRQIPEMERKIKMEEKDFEP